VQGSPRKSGYLTRACRSGCQGRLKNSWGINHLGGFS
jgi:hypothetical protein